MHNFTVKSNDITEVGYDDEILYITFQNKGTHAYYDVPGKVFKEMFKAREINDYYLNNVKNVYNWDEFK